MILNYFKLAWRSLRKNKAFSLLNIAGLAIGMCCTMLILLWVYQERSWDKHNEHYQNIYHIFSHRDFNGEINTGPDMMYPLAGAIKDNIPEIEAATALTFPEQALYTNGDIMLKKTVVQATPDYFKLFTHQFIEGNATGFSQTDGLILTESTARALFGSTNILGKQVMVNNKRNTTVSAVIRDLPKTSSIQFDVLEPVNSSSPFFQQAANDWINCNLAVYVKTKAGAQPQKLESSIMNLIRSRVKDPNPTTRGSITLHPMAKWRLYEEFKGGKNTGGRIAYVKLFTWIAIIILVIACINFMNLSTSRSEKRAKEVGIRKTLGSEKAQLLFQFLAESILVAFIAFLLAVVLFYLVLPGFNALLKTEISIPYHHANLWLVIIAIIIGTGLVAGSYPAFFLSAFQPVKVLKGTYAGGKGASLPRKLLVTGQFIVSIVLISATIIVYRQIQFVQQRDLGYKQDNLVMVHSSEQLNQNYTAFRNELMQSGLVASISRSSNPLTDIFGYTSGVSVKGPVNNNPVLGFFFADANFSGTVQARMIEGRDFQVGDTNSVLLNKEAVKLLGLKNPVGQDIKWAGRDRRVVGVIDNMVMLSPYEAPTPILINYEEKWSNMTTIRLAEHADVRKAIAQIEQTYKQLSPATPFQYQFVDEAFQEKFDNEQLVGKLALAFSGLAIFICCLGLFGLVASTIERRTREIGIRKVLGASVGHLLVLMSKDFIILVGIAFLVAIPAAWWLMHEWLANYAYRVNIHIGLFGLVGLLIACIAILTVSLNAWRAALSNPVKTLRNE
ncbi:ABC transporter permease [Flavihumibacter rivuli]|uniref:ABC transporter permease n=1 Tax=Flavihumibacter rivuli TaxID=2838156 RepID=UPI001BDEA7D3|nr:ABC transporter permease [Flavihumibacter rivuli]ULQ57159.1 ABC transporter permease [Flavihumibacter rivuli]